MHDVEVEVVDAPVGELFAADWLGGGMLVWGVLERGGGRGLEGEFGVKSERDCGERTSTLSPSWKEFQSLETMKRSSLLTRPSLIARATPSPASFSLP